MTATEPAVPAPVAPAVPPEAFTVTRTEWQRLLDRVAEQEATIRQLQQRVGALPAPTEPRQGRPAGTSILDAYPHIAAASAAYYAELDDLLAHLAAHPAEKFVAYRGRQRVRFGTDEAALEQELGREYPDGQYHVMEIDELDKYAGDTAV